MAKDDSKKPADARIDRRYGPHPKETALCCECGEVRTIGAHYQHTLDRTFDPRRVNDVVAQRFLKAGYKPVEVPDGWYRLTHARCAHCRALTRHATISATGNWAEEQDRKVQVKG
jgi:hypothetical protein